MDPEKEHPDTDPEARETVAAVRADSEAVVEMQGAEESRGHRRGRRGAGAGSEDGGRGHRRGLSQTCSGPRLRGSSGVKGKVAEQRRPDSDACGEFQRGWQGGQQRPRGLR